VSAARVEVATRPPYQVRIGSGLLPGALDELAQASCAVITDANVERLHAERLGRLAEAPRHVLPPGEASKSLAELDRIFDLLARAELDRSSLLVAFGGGVVGDIGGLAAALYLRGIRWVQVPTTLLAQVDASVGGKTAIDLPAGKNLVGAFHQPMSVIADVALLETLPDDELRSGLGEIVKTALIGDPELLRILEAEAEHVLARERQLLEEIVQRCVRVKAAIVARDEHEAGERRQLNLGHTFAHAIETAAGHGHIPHGIAVGVGLVLAVRASARAGLLSDPELEGSLVRLLQRLGLPTGLDELRELSGARLAGTELRAAMRHDKKRVGGAGVFVLVAQPGEVRLGELEDRELATLLA